MTKNVQRAQLRRSSRRVLVALVAALAVLVSPVLLATSATAADITPEIPSCAEMNQISHTSGSVDDRLEVEGGEIGYSQDGYLIFYPSDGNTAVAGNGWVFNDQGQLVIPVDVANTGCELYTPPLFTCDDIASLLDGEGSVPFGEGTITAIEHPEAEQTFLIFETDDPTLVLVTNGNGWGWVEFYDWSDPDNLGASVWKLGIPLNEFECYTPPVPTCDELVCLGMTGGPIEVEHGVLSIDPVREVVIYTLTDDVTEPAIMLQSGDGWVLTDEGTLEISVYDLGCPTYTHTPRPTDPGTTGTQTSTATATATATETETSTATATGTQTPSTASGSTTPGSTATTSGPQLASTGADILWAAIGALVLLVGGGLAVLAVRRRNQSE